MEGFSFSLFLLHLHAHGMVSSVSVALNSYQDNSIKRPWCCTSSLLSNRTPTATTLLLFNRPQSLIQTGSLVHLSFDYCGERGGFTVRWRPGRPKISFLQTGGHLLLP